MIYKLVRLVFHHEPGTLNVGRIQTARVLATGTFERVMAAAALCGPPQLKNDSETWTFFAIEVHKTKENHSGY